MRRPAQNRFAIVCCFLAVVTLPAISQQEDGLKEADPSTLSYSQEGAVASTAPLMQKESELRAALAARPDSPDLLYALATVLQQETKSKESLALFTQAAKYRNPGPQELRSVAFNYVLLNDYEDAIHWLEAALRMEPSNVNVLYALGRCYYSKNRFLEAETMYSRVLALQPHHLKAEENLGLAYDATDQPDKAEEALRRATFWADPHGTDPWPFLDLGSFLLDQDRYPEAVDSLRVATHIQPMCASCHEKLGRGLIAIGEKAEGISELEKAIQLDPGNPKTHYELGRALREMGEINRARSEFTISQKLYSQHSAE